VAVKEPKTKIMASMLEALKLSGKTLLVLADSNKDVLRASKNIAKLNVKNYKDVNTMDFLLCEDVVISKQALEKLPERL